jgi:molybdopterin-guanine dinucleotide biosynthesis protein A
LPRKLWLGKPGDDTVPPEATGIVRVLGWNEDRPRIAGDLIEAWLQEAWRATPVYAGILIGGRSSRMGRPKHLIEKNGKTWIENTTATIKGHVDQTVLLGAGEVPPSLGSLPVLPDAEDAEGPLRGMRAALRWAPRAGWLFIACDQPGISPAAVEWLLSHRRPGVRAVMPVLPGASDPEPLLAYYDFRMAAAMERVRRPCDMAAAPGVATPTVPGDFTSAWRNINVPADLDGNSETRKV